MSVHDRKTAPPHREMVMMLNETRLQYGYKESAQNQYALLRNKVLVLVGSEASVWDFIHYGLDISVYEALHYHGYTIVPTDQKTAEKEE